MKQTLSILITSLLVLFSLSGCGKMEKYDSNKPNIVTTMFSQYDFARQIAGNNANIKMLLKPGAESHSYEPTPQDIKTIQNADLFIYTGGENDIWIDDILLSMGETKPDTLKLMDCVPIVNEEVVEGMEKEHEHSEDGIHHAEADEHVWTSPKNAIMIVEKMSELMAKHDPVNADTYKKNTTDYIQKLNVLDASFKNVVENGCRKTILFGDRFPFRYFADTYGLDYYAAFTGCSTDTEVNASTIAFLIDKVKAEKLPVVFTIEFSNGKIADSICNATGAKRLTLYSCHNVTKDEFETGETYLSLMEKNVQSLKEALN
ncbi:MAG: metal ABC transporter substrate-binding protein [Cellulosilyticaceae bacterium]